MKDIAEKSAWLRIIIIFDEQFLKTNREIYLQAWGFTQKGVYCGCLPAYFVSINLSRRTLVNSFSYC